MSCVCCGAEIVNDDKTAHHNDVMPDYCVKCCDHRCDAYPGECLPVVSVRTGNPLSSAEDRRHGAAQSNYIVECSECGLVANVATTRESFAVERAAEHRKSHEPFNAEKFLEELW